MYSSPEGRNLFRFLGFFWAILLAGNCYAVQAYHIGNSLTLGLDLGRLTNWATARGQTYTGGRHIQLGARLHEIWVNPSGNQFPVAPYGSFNTALPNNSFDVLTLEPYLESAATAQARIADFTQLAAGDPQVYVYQIWPWKAWGDYAVNWNRTANGSGDITMPTRSYYQQLMGNLDPATRLIPTGEVLYEVDALIKAGGLPGFASITQLYLDDNCTCHLNDVGNLVLASTVFATIFKQDPSGLPIPESVTPQAGLILQQVAWDVVTGHHHSGVPEQGDFNADGVVDARDYTVWRDGLGSVYTEEDYDDWRAHFGFVAEDGAGSWAGSIAVPEPIVATPIICTLTICTIVRRWRR